MCQVLGFLELHMNVSKQIYLLQVDTFSTNKSVTILEASRRILNTQCDKISVFANVKNF
jgi:hypothetical protein